MLKTLALVFLLVSLCAADEDFDFDEGGDEHGGDEHNHGGEEEHFHARGEHVSADGKKKSCTSNEDCYDQREPPAWCRPTEQQKWTDRGCFCDDKAKACMIERENAGKMEHTECAPEEGYVCA